MQNLIRSIPVSSDRLPGKPTQALDHLPGPRGHWLTGNINQLTPNPQPFLSAQQQRYGSSFTVGFFRNRRALMMIGPQANELLLLDRNNNFSSRLGWDVLTPFFGRNILVRDFEDHRAHRKLMTAVFKTGALAEYLQQMNPIVRRATKRYTGVANVYSLTKEVTLEIAIRVFAGIADHQDVQAWYNDLNLVLSNAMAHRIRLPGTKFTRAMRARDRLQRRLLAELERRRESPGDDLFSQLASQRDEQGCRLSDQDVIDHMFGILFAAHDTTASSLAMMFWLLAGHPHWQDRARGECQALYDQTGSAELEYQQLDQLPIIDAVFKEALRLYAPIQFFPRRNVAGFEFAGHEVPANTSILLAPQVTHFDPQYFPQPATFDPERFLNPSRKLPAFAFVPFGKGSHMCLGMHFAAMEIKAVLYGVLLARNLARQGDAPVHIEYLPIVRPRKAIKVSFSPR